MLLTLLIWTALFFYPLVDAQARSLTIDGQSVVADPRLPGNIYDRNQRPLVTNLPVYAVYADASLITSRPDQNQIISSLSSALNLLPADISAGLDNHKGLVWIQHGIPQDVYQRLQDLKLPGVGFVPEIKRFYPNHNLAAHVLGFRDSEDKGMDGVEQSYDRYLKTGRSLVLTIDRNIQLITERTLYKMCKRYHARAGSIVIMNPKTGEILAMANSPTYDLGSAQEASTEGQLNRAIALAYQPGSVFKIVLASAALQEGVVKETDIIDCEHGSYHVVSDHLLHDHERFGLLTFKQVIENSSNIGTTKVAQRLGLHRLYKYVHRFRFGRLTGIDLPDEAPGELKPVPLWTKAAVAAVPIGQEVPVTTIQLLAAISAIANNGLYMRPFVVKYIKDDHGRVLKENKPRTLARVISPSIAKRVKAILQGVVEVGTGKYAQVKGITVAGKTGTAQKIVDGVYSHIYFYTVFAGFMPVDDPQLSAVVVFDEPHPLYYSARVSAPVFRKVMEQVLKYLEAKEHGSIHT